MELLGGGSSWLLRLILSFVLISSFLENGPISSSHAWDNAEYEMYDLVEEINKNFYEVLGVTADASSKEIKSAYRKLSVKIHPDKNPAPDASEKFRQLVGIYEVLKDDNLRKAYDDVLVNGLPNWRQPIFYFRRARKLAIWQVSLILMVIISVGQYLAGWASYFEKRLSMREVIEARLRQKQRSRKAQKDGPTMDEIEAEMEEYLPKPSLWNILPFQILRGIKYLIFNAPGDLLAHMQYVKEQKEEEARELEREQKLLEEQLRRAQEPKKPRKRKTFKAPEKEESDGEDDDGADQDEQQESIKVPVKPKYLSGGLWTDEDLGELAKLCNKFPGGTPDRWEKISDALRRPVPEVIFMAKKVMERLSQKKEEEEEQRPQLKVKVKTKGGKADAIAAAASGDLEAVASWSADEQKYLEKALLVYPKGALERWDKISNMVPGRTKEECMARFKYVAELVKKKKEEAKAPPPTEEEAASESTALQTESECPPAAAAVVESKSSSSTPDEELSKDSVERKNSSSSNKSNSDSDWCIVEPTEN